MVVVLEVDEVAAELLEGIGGHRCRGIAFPFMFDADIFDEAENRGEEGKIIAAFKMNAQTGVSITVRGRIARSAHKTIGNCRRIFKISRLDDRL